MERITPEKAVQILKDDEITVTIEEAKIIIDFLYAIGEIVVEQYLSQGNTL